MNLALVIPESGEEKLYTASWVILLVLPPVLSDWQTIQFAAFFCYGIFAISLGFVWGWGGLLCLGQAVFFGVGAYVMSVITLGMLPGFESLVSSWIAVIAAVLIATLAANLLGRLFFHGRGLRGAFFGLVTLALAFIAERIATNWNFLGGLNGLMSVPPINLGLNGGGFEVWEAVPLYYSTLLISLTVFVLLSLLLKSPYGKIIRAIRDDEDRTRFFGYDTGDYKLTVFSIGGAVAGLAGALFVAQFGFASPPLIGFGLSAEVLIWVALGGRGHLMAAFMGAILVRFLESFLSELLGGYWILGLGLIFVLVVMYFPRGLISEIFYQLGRKLDRK